MKNPASSGGGSSSIGANSGSGGVAGAAAAAMGGNFPPISCYNSSFFNDQYSQHQRMYFNSGLFGNLHSQSQSFNTSAASHLLDSTLRSDHTLSSKYQLLHLVALYYLFILTISVYLTCSACKRQAKFPSTFQKLHKMKNEKKPRHSFTLLIHKI